MTADGKIKALLITGIVTDEHDKRVSPMLRYMLESTGRFKVKITEEFKGATAETLEGYDLIILNYDGKEERLCDYVGLGETAEKTIFDFVANGGGIVMYHSSIILGDPAFPEEFVKLAGMRFDLRDGGRKNPKLSFRVDIARDDEITGPLPDFFLVQTDDIFCNGALSPDAKVLATVDDNVEDYASIPNHFAADFNGADFSQLPGIGTKQPVAWRHNYGKGRVFSMFVGHGPTTLNSVAFTAFMVRGSEWAATGKVTIPPPDIQNERRKNYWPYYNDVTTEMFADMHMF